MAFQHQIERRKSTVELSIANDHGCIVENKYR
jgi:hypothetical protein